MSLINDMLQDLDQQRQRQQQPQPHPGTGERGRSTKPWLFAIGAFVLVAVLLWVVLPRSVFVDSSGQEAVSELTTLSAITAQVEPAPVNIELQAEVAVAEEAGEASPVNLARQMPEQNLEVTGPSADTSLPESTDTQRWLADLLRAEQALAQDRLMLPAHDSAYLYYQRVLAVDPGNSAAEQGLERISDRYVALAESARTRGRNAEAQGFIERALQVKPGYNPALQLQQAAALLPTVAAETKPQSAPEPRESAPSVAELVTGTSRVTPSQALYEQRQVREAEVLVSTGQIAEAKARLEALIAANDAAQTPLADARNLLLGLYLQTGQVKSAEALVEQALPPVLQACLSARILLHKGEPATALSALERAGVGESRNESCRTLLAGLYQRTGQYEAAQSHYRRLLDNFGERGRYWLGLALALDEQQAYAAASTAYRRVLQSGDAAPELMAFAEQRLQQLGN